MGPVERLVRPQRFQSAENDRAATRVLRSKSRSYFEPGSAGRFERLAMDLDFIHAEARGLGLSEAAALRICVIVNREVAVERKRWEESCVGKRHDGCNYTATCGSVCNKCGAVA